MWLLCKCFIFFQQDYFKIWAKLFLCKEKKKKQGSEHLFSKIIACALIAWPALPVLLEYGVLNQRLLVVREEVGVDHVVEGQLADVVQRGGGHVQADGAVQQQRPEESNKSIINGWNLMNYHERTFLFQVFFLLLFHNFCGRSLSFFTYQLYLSSKSECSDSVAT